MRQTFEELVEHCVQYFEQHSFSAPRIDRYKYLWKKKLMPYMAKDSILYYDASVSERFVNAKIAGSIVTPCERDIIRSDYVLNEFQEKGAISKRSCNPLKRKLSGTIGHVMEDFLLHLESLACGKSTISGHRLYLYRLLIYLESRQVDI